MLDLSFLNLNDDFSQIYEKLQKVENLEIFHNGYYLPIYFKKSFVKIGKAKVMEVLKDHKNCKLVRENGKYRIIKKY